MRVSVTSASPTPITDSIHFRRPHLRCSTNTSVETVLLETSSHTLVVSHRPLVIVSRQMVPAHRLDRFAHFPQSRTAPDSDSTW